MRELLSSPSLREVDRCAALSRRFGAAHQYFRSHGDSMTSWCVAERGKIVRWYDMAAPEEQIGVPEAGFKLPHEPMPWPHAAYADLDRSVEPREFQLKFVERFQQLKEQDNVPDAGDADTIAARLSLLPGDVGSDTKVEGRGVLAFTTCAAREEAAGS